MFISRRSHRHRFAAVRVAAVVAFVATGLIHAADAALAASCNGASHESTLSAGKATPGSGVLGTTFRFSVRYEDTAGCPASSVVLVIPGLGSTAMTAATGQPLAGVTYRVSRQLPVGVWTYRFEATSGSGHGLRTIVLLQVSPTSLTVVAPTPAPTPRSEPKATPTPSVAANPTAPPPSRSPGSNAGPSPTAAVGAGPGAGPGSGKPPTGAPSPAPGAHEPSSEGAPPGTVGRGHPGGAAPGAGSSGGSAKFQAALGGPGSDVMLPILTWVLTTGLGVALYAIALRRSDNEDSSPLAAALSLGAHALANRWPGPGSGTQDPSRTGTSSSHSDADQPHEPRAGGAVTSQTSGWRFRPPLRFETEPAEGVERRRITYRLVRLSDEPDDLRSREVMRLDRGDDIDILGSADRFLQVRTPSGEVGWIPRTAVIG